MEKEGKWKITSWKRKQEIRKQLKGAGEKAKLFPNNEKIKIKKLDKFKKSALKY